ncbi:MAG TPA: winged helix-turn-helix domain-containing protein [Clostridia bacterium]|nr:winged helix-turn-helix domain-containing protein [Clostridia bacterium]
MKKIELTTKEELNIYMSHVRQQLLRQLSISGVPMTPKMLADKLHISASAAQHHIKKLMSLGLIEPDHTESINGITASFYKPAQVTVQIGLGRNDDLVRQRDALMQDSIAQVYDGFCDHMQARLGLSGSKDIDGLRKWGDILTGVAYLNDEESRELMKLIDNFIEKHATPGIDSHPWEYALIVYNAEEAPAKEEASAKEEAPTKEGPAEEKPGCRGTKGRDTSCRETEDRGTGK